MKKWLTKGNSTFIKYILSYIIVLGVSFIGFTCVFQYKIKEEYVNNLNTQNITSINNIASLIGSSITEINQTQSILERNTNLILTRYSEDQMIHYNALRDLKNQLAGNILISDILYINLLEDTVISTDNLVKYMDGSYYIHIDREAIRIPVDDLTSSVEGKYTILKAKKRNLILYSPAHNSTRYSFIFLINELELKKLMQIDNDMYSIMLTDLDNNPIYGINQEKLEPYLSELKEYEHGIYELEDGPIAYIAPSFNNLFKITAISERELLLNTVDMVFKGTYLIFAIIAILSIILIVISMKMTYGPLYKLTKKLTLGANTQCNCIEQIHEVIIDAKAKNQELQGKINDYRVVMQRSILDNIVLESNSKSITQDIAQIDNFFNPNFNNSFFVVKVLFMRHKLDVNDIKEYITLGLSSDSACIPLETTSDYSVLLINYTGTEQDKEDVIRLFFEDFYNETGCYAAISNSSSNPMDIPSLYEKALVTSECFSKNPVETYDKVGNMVSQRTTLSYPYKRLESFTNDLGKLDFENAHKTLHELFQIINENNNPEFFIRSLLLDILTLIINLMSKSNIKFEKFNDIYFETLYFCRSHKYGETSDCILNNIHSLLSIFESEMASMTIQISQIRQFIMNNYQNSEFSITLLAEHFNVSIAYMSYLFKKKTDSNLSDYVWELRLEKAKELLTNTTKSIDEISIEVGYLNPSSFRRKFKQTTNISPSQFRQTEGRLASN